MSTVVKDLGAVSAYAYAVEKGYTGTEAEFAELMASYAEVGQRAEDAAESALNSKTAAQTAATTATNKASEATTAAQTATTKAGEAATAAGTATTAKNDAVAAKTAAETAQGKAEDAQAAAESVAESIPSDYSQLSEDVSDLKEDLSELYRPTQNNLLGWKTLDLTINNVKVTSTGDGIINVKGTANASGGRLTRLTNASTLSQGTYTISCISNTSPQVVLNKTNGEFLLGIDNGNGSRIFTLNEASDVFIGINVANGTTYNADIKIQVEEGDKASDWIPSKSVCDYVARKANSENSTDVAKISENVARLKKNTTTTYGTIMEQGTISGAGADTDNTNRIRTKDFYLKDGLTASVDSGYGMWVASYNADKKFIRIDTTTITIFDSESISDPNVKYLRFVVIRGNGTSAITPNDETGFTLSANTDSLIRAELDKIKNRHFSAFKDYSRIVISGSVFSDMTIVGSHLVGAISGSDDRSTTNGTLRIYNFDNGFDSAYSSVVTKYHLFGHCNSIDYNPFNDCLIFGNGSGDYNLQGEIIIIPNFASIITESGHDDPNDPLTLDGVNAIVIDCASYNLGTKFNVIWGERNGVQNNIAYLITAKYGSSTSATDGGDNGVIRRLLLGIGSNIFEYGNAITVGSAEFNGTFKILDTYTQTGTAYAQANQGSCFYDGQICACIGHDGMWMWKMRLDNTDHRIWYDEYKQATYDLAGDRIVSNQANTTGICISDEYMFIGIVNIGIVAISL